MRLRSARTLSIAILLMLTLPASADFLRGDANLDGRFDISDPSRVLGYLFKGKDAVVSDAMDVNDDGGINISDGIAAYNALFLGGQVPAPFPQPGTDPTVDTLETVDSALPGELPRSGRLRLDVPSAISALPGTELQIPVTVLMDTNSHAVDAWTFGLATSDNVRIAEFDVAGTVSTQVDEGGMMQSGFEATRLVQDGLVSAVELSLTNSVSLGFNSTFTLLQLTLEGTVPDNGVTETWELSFPNSIPSDGLPVEPILAVNGRPFMPNLTSAEIQVRGDGMLRWMNEASGRWDDPQNWSLPFSSAGTDNVLIEPARGLTIEGSSVNRTANSLSLGTTGSGRAVLELGQGDLTVRETMAVQETGEFHVADRVVVAGRFVNRGLVSGGGQIDAPLSNLVSGAIRIGELHRLTFSANVRHDNSGLIEVIGGVVEIDGALVNKEEMGAIVGRDAEFRFHGGLDNIGSFGISFGTSDVFGDIDNRGIVTIAGGSMVTFYDDVENDGEVNVMKDSTAVYFGAVSGRGRFPGEGTHVFAGDLRPGASPGRIEFDGSVIVDDSNTTQLELAGTIAEREHDQIVVHGSLSLAGSLQVDPLAPYDDPIERGDFDRFELILGTERTGTFETVTYGGRTLVPRFAADADGSFRTQVGKGLFRSLAYGENSVSLVNYLAIPGDANGNGQFNTEDFVVVFQAGEYEDQVFDNSDWTEGDWNGDLDFDSGDLVLAFQDGRFETGSVFEDQLVAVPEAAGALMFLLGVASVALLLAEWQRSPTDESGHLETRSVYHRVSAGGRQHGTCRRNAQLHLRQYR